MKFTVYQSSRQGGRAYNQDRIAYSYSKEALLAVVADGMGGHRHGEIAAQLAVATLTTAFEQQALPRLQDPSVFLREHLLQVHDAIGNFARANALIEAPRTTIVAVVMQDGKFYCAHAGDSRLYHFRSGKQLYRTEDHSVVQMLYQRGQITAEDMQHHPDRNKIYNCLGGEKAPAIEIGDAQKLRDGDTLLLCSDGLWSAMHDDGLTAALHAAPVTESLPRLLDMAEALNGQNGDNLSAIGLQWGDTSDDEPFAISTLTMGLDAATTILNPVASQQADSAHDLSDDDIERAIAEIQAALRKTQR